MGNDPMMGIPLEKRAMAMIAGEETLTVADLIDNLGISGLLRVIVRVAKLKWSIAPRPKGHPHGLQVAIRRRDTLEHRQPHRGTVTKFVGLDPAAQNHDDDDV